MATAKGSHCALNTAAPAMRIAEGMYTPVMYCGASGPVGLAVCLVDMMVAVVDARFLCTVVVSKPHQARPHEVVGKQGIYSEANGSQLGSRGTIICITLGLHKHPTNTCLPDIVGIPAAESLPHKGQVFPRVRLQPHLIEVHRYYSGLEKMYPPVRQAIASRIEEIDDG